MSNKQRSDNLRAKPDENKADLTDKPLTPQQIGAETRKKNAEIAAKKELDARALRLKLYLEKLNCPNCKRKAKDTRWVVIGTKGNIRYVDCMQCRIVTTIDVE